MYIKSDICNPGKLGNICIIFIDINISTIVMKINERIIRDELLSRCGHLIDNRQHGFMFHKSCNTQLLKF